jgi:Ankyrin repeat
VKQELQLLRIANPQNLNETYKRLYMNTVTQNERENTAKTYRVILSAYEPLTIKEVVQAVSIGRNGEIHNHVNAEYIRSRCHNFIVENEDGFLQFAHQSARLFLEKAENHGDKNFVDVDDFSDTANHREMAKICLQLMLRPDHPMWLIGKLDSVQLKGEFGFLNMLTKIEKPRHRPIFLEWAARRGFSQYAFSYWTDHCRKLGSTLSLGQELSRDLQNGFFAPQMAFSWWFRLVHGLKVGKLAFRLDTIRTKTAKEIHKAYRSEQLSKIRSEVAHCLPNISSESEYLSPHPLFAVCVWNLAECLDQPQVRDFLRVHKWPTIPQSPLHACCWLGSNQTFSNLIQHYPEKVWELMFKASGVGQLPIEAAVLSGEVNMTESLLRFERDRTKHHGYWSSRQLSSLGSLDTMVMSFPDEDTIHMVTLLLKFEADQTGAHFPQRRGECWASELAQRIRRDGRTPLEIAAYYADAKVVSLLLQAGAKPSTRSRVSSPLAEALSRCDEKGPKIVEMLLSKDPAVCDTVTDRELINYLSVTSSLEAASHMLRRRPELARMQRQ